MLGLIFQIIISVFTGIISFIQLRERFRKKNKIAKLEGYVSLSFVILLVLFSIWSQVTNNFDSRQKEKQLDNNLRILSTKNDALEKQLTMDNMILVKRVDSSTNTLANIAATKALQASKELKNTSDSIRKIIQGTDIPPSLIITAGEKYIKFFLVNHDDLPLYCTVNAINYTNQEGCNIKGNTISDSCVNANKIIFDIIAKKDVWFPFSVPHGPSNFSQFKIFKVKLMIKIRAKSYGICSYLTTINHEAVCAAITYQYDSKNRRSIYKIDNKWNIPVNWEKEFPKQMENLVLQ